MLLVQVIRQLTSLLGDDYIEAEICGRVPACIDQLGDCGVVLFSSKLLHEGQLGPQLVLHRRSTEVANVRGHDCVRVDHFPGVAVRIQLGDLVDSLILVIQSMLVHFGEPRRVVGPSLMLLGFDVCVCLRLIPRIEVGESRPTFQSILLGLGGRCRVRHLFQSGCLKLFRAWNFQLVPLAVKR